MKTTGMRRRAGSGISDKAIIMEHVSKAYTAGVPALNDVTLHINKGEFVFIVGDSGSGKSTLIKLLLRELTATEGNVKVLGYDLNRIRHRKIPEFRRNIGIVFQDFRLLKDRNVYENVAFAQRVMSRPPRRSKKACRPCSPWWGWRKNTSLIQGSSPVGSSREWPWQEPW